MTLTYKLADGGSIDVDVEDLSSYDHDIINTAMPLLLEAQDWGAVGYRGLRRMVNQKHTEARKKVTDIVPRYKQAVRADHLHLAQELGHWCELYMHTYHWQLTCDDSEKASWAGKSIPAHNTPLDLRTAIHRGRHYVGVVMLEAVTKKEVDFQVLLRKLDTLATGALSPATTAPASTAPATALPSIWHQEGMLRAASASATPDATARDPTVIVAGFVVGAALRYRSTLLTALNRTYYYTCASVTNPRGEVLDFSSNFRKESKQRYFRTSKNPHLQKYGYQYHAKFRHT